MKKIILLVLGLFLSFQIAVPKVKAAEFRVDEEGGNIIVSEDEVVKNLFTAGNVISIKGMVEKSLYAGGNTITVDGDVEDDLFIGGSSVVIRGDVGGSIYTGGANVSIEGRVEDNVFVGGGNVSLSSTSSVGGDLFVGGGVVDIQSPVLGDVYIGGGQVVLNSTVGGKIKAEVEDLKFGSKAEVMGEVVHKSTKEATVAEGASLMSGIDFQEKTVDEAQPFAKPYVKPSVKPDLFLKLVSVGFLLKLLASTTVALVFVYVFGKIAKELVRESLVNFWPSLGIGFAGLFLTPILAVILFITLLGAMLGGLVLVEYVLMILLAVPLASVTFGSWLMKLFKSEKEYKVNWQTTVLGVVLMSMVSMLPFVGWLVSFLFMLLSLGSLYRMAYQKLAASR